MGIRRSSSSLSLGVTVVVTAGPDGRYRLVRGLEAQVER
jgi:hypothetical protein